MGADAVHAWPSQKFSLGTCTVRKGLRNIIKALVLLLTVPMEDRVRNNILPTYLLPGPTP